MSDTTKPGVRSAYIIRRTRESEPEVIESAFYRPQFATFVNQVDSRAGGSVQYVNQDGKVVMSHPRVKEGLF